MAPLVWATEETKLWYLRLWNSAKILVLGPTCVPGFEYVP